MTNGQIGEAVEGFNVAKAALYWGVSPDEALHMCSYWIALAEVIVTAENAVREKKQGSAKTPSSKTPGKGGKRGGGRYR